MNKIIIIIAMAGVLTGGILLAQKNPGDAEAAAEVIKDMTAEELNGTPGASNVLGPPDLAGPVILSILEMLKDPEANGGLLGIAQSNNCSMAQVKIVRAEKRKKLQELAEAQAEPIE